MVGVSVCGMSTPHQLPTDAQQEEQDSVQQVFIPTYPAVHVCEVIVHQKIDLLFQFV